MKRLFLIFLLPFSLFSCSNSSQPQIVACDSVSEEEIAVVADAPPASVSGPEFPSGQKLVASGSVNINVTANTVDSVYAKISMLIDKYKGYKREDNKWVYSVSIAASIPSNSFKAFCHDIERVGGTITEKAIEVRDVSLECHDVASAISSKQAALDRYRTLLASANKVSEVIEIQKRIDEIQEELDRYISRKNQLDNKIAFSQININLHIIDRKEVRADDGVSFFSRLSSAFSDGAEVLRFIFFGIIRIWPVSILVIAFLLYRRHRKNKKNS